MPPYGLVSGLGDHKVKRVQHSVRVFHHRFRKMPRQWHWVGGLIDLDQRAFPFFMQPF